MPSKSRLLRCSKKYKRTFEQRKRISKSKKGKKNPMFGLKGIQCPHWGYKHSKITKIKIGLSGIGRKQSKETKLKRANAWMGNKNPNYKRIYSKKERLEKSKRSKKYYKRYWCFNS
jgi:hypothetical protein